MPPPAHVRRGSIPAWAQVAAAAVIFAAGAGTGMMQGSKTQNVASPPASTIALQQSVAALEQRLAGLEGQAQARTAAAEVPVAGRDTEALMRQVREAIAASERRQNVKLAKWSLQMMAEQNEVQTVSEEQIRASINNMAVRFASYAK
jgi:hypothetical protein